MTKGSGIESVLSIAGDVVFYFLPFMIAFTASKKLKVDTTLSMVLAGCLLYPSIINNSGQNIFWSFFGLPLPLVKYSASVIPILLGVFILKYVHKYVDKIVPRMLKIIFTPLITILIMIPIQLIALGPIGYYLSGFLVMIINYLFQTSSLLAGFVYGALRPLMVVTGMHLTLAPIQLESLDKLGYELISPISAMNILATAGVALAVFCIGKDKNLKSTAMSSVISANIGITEPALYGIAMKFKTALISIMLSTGISGAFVAYFGGKAYAFSIPGLLSLPTYAGPEFNYILIGFVIAFLSGFIIMRTLGIKENTKKIETTNVNNNMIYSPLDGTIISLDAVNDNTFKSEAIECGIAIISKSNKIVAPFDGELISVFPTKHAIMLKSTDGIELLIHIGLETVNLNGEYFELYCKDGRKISKGDILLEVDFEKIKSLGYDIVTPILVTNSNNYLKVVNIMEDGLIYSKEPIIEVIKQN